MVRSEKKPFFYGWVILAQGFLLMFINGGGVFHAFGVFFPEMMAELGWLRGVGASAFSIMILMTGVMAAPTGMLLTRFGIRKVMITGNIIMVTALVIMSGVTEVWQMYLAFGILAGTAIVSSGFIPVVTLANNWFIKRRALAIGIILAGVGVGTLVLAPINRFLIDLLSWRQAWLVIAAIDFTIGLLPAIILTRAKPEDMGQMPDGVSITEEELEQAIASPDNKAPVDWETGAALKTPFVWLVAGMMAANLFAGSVLTTHQVAYLQDIGISPMAAASAIGLMIGISTLGRLAGGALGDKFQLRYVAAIACAVEAIALIVLINVKTMGLVYLYVIVFGVPYGMIIVLFPAMIGAYFGRKNYSTIFGISNTMVQFIGAIGPALAGFIFDATGSYSAPLTIVAVFCVIGGICAFIARPPNLPQ